MANFDTRSMQSALAGTVLDNANTGILRPGFAKTGRPFPIYTNAFAVTPPTITCYHYAIKITPDTPTIPPKINRKIWEHLDKVLNIFDGVAVAYDSRAMAYSPVRLPADEGNWIIELPEESGERGGRSFGVSIRFTRAIDLSKLGVFISGAQGEKVPATADIQSAVQALNVLIQHGPSMLHPNRAASFFLPPDNKNQSSLAKGLELWRGYYSSLRPGINKMFLNLDIASQPMYQSGNLPEVILAYLKGSIRSITFAELTASNIAPRAALEVDRFLRNVKVTLKVGAPGCPPGTEPVRKIKGFERASADESTFAAEDGTMISVASYFKTQYNISLQRPDFPLIRISKTGLWPIELCEVAPGQTYTRKLDPDQTADAIKLTTVNPRDRLPLLRTGLAKIAPAGAEASALGQWGLKIEKEPITIMARELNAPTVTYKRNVQPREGIWDQKGQTFHQAATIESWLVLVFDTDRFFSVQEAQNAVMGLVGACGLVGIDIKDKRPPIHYVNRSMPLNTFIMSKGSELVKETGIIPQMIICFLPRKPCDEYAAIKKFGDIEMGVATQCLFINKAKKGNPQYFSNISMKINVKLRGTNSVLDNASLGPIAEMPTMVFGADVTHPSPGSLAPSIAAVVGSQDSKITRYGTNIKVQSSRVELIDHLDDMVLPLLKQFESNLKTRPKRIIFFRDGVSEGQYNTAINTEVAAIKLACVRLDRDYAPLITYVVCGKRHHFSFFPKNEQDADRRTGNVKPGTTIDTDITSPFQFDWYTQSHASLLGTGRSSHYTVLVDESNFSADVLQQLVFNLCFTYARCTRAVSYVTPAYYASRVCTRAQLLLKRDDDDGSTVFSAHSGGSEEKIRDAQLKEYTGRLKTIHVNHAESLYFL